MKWAHYLIIGQLMGLAFMGGLLMRLLLNMDVKLDTLLSAEQNCANPQHGEP